MVHTIHICMKLLHFNFQNKKARCPLKNSTSRKCRKVFRLWWVKSFFSKYSKFKCDSVDQLLAQQKCCPLPASSKRCPFHWSYQSSSQGSSGHHNLHCGYNLFQKWQVLHHSHYFLLVQWVLDYSDLDNRDLGYRDPHDTGIFSQGHFRVPWFLVDI